MGNNASAQVGTHLSATSAHSEPLKSHDQDAHTTMRRSRSSPNAGKKQQQRLGGLSTTKSESSFLSRLSRTHSTKNSHTNTSTSTTSSTSSSRSSTKRSKAPTSPNERTAAPTSRLSKSRSTVNVVAANANEPATSITSVISTTTSAPILSPVHAPPPTTQSSRPNRSILLGLNSSRPPRATTDASGATHHGVRFASDCNNTEDVAHSNNTGDTCNSGGVGKMQTPPVKSRKHSTAYHSASATSPSSPRRRSSKTRSDQQQEQEKVHQPRGTSDGHLAALPSTATAHPTDANHMNAPALSTLLRVPNGGHFAASESSSSLDANTNSSRSAPLSESWSLATQETSCARDASWSGPIGGRLEDLPTDSQMGPNSDGGSGHRHSSFSLSSFLETLTSAGATGGSILTTIASVSSQQATDTDDSAQQHLQATSSSDSEHPHSPTSDRKPQRSILVQTSDQAEFSTSALLPPPSSSSSSSSSSSLLHPPASLASSTASVSNTAASSVSLVTAASVLSSDHDISQRHHASSVQHSLTTLPDHSTPAHPSNMTSVAQIAYHHSHQQEHHSHHHTQQHWWTFRFAKKSRPDTTLDTISDTPKRLSSTKAGSLKDDGGEAVTPKHQQQRPAKLSIGNRALRFLGRPVTPPTTPKPHGRRKRHGNNNNSNSKSLQTSQNLQSSVCSDELTRGSTTTDEWERLSMDDEASGVHMSRISAVDYAQHDGMSIHHDHRDLDKSQTDEHTQRGRKKRWWHTFTRSTTRHGSSSTDSGHSSETSSLASIEGSGKNTWNSRSMRQKKPARRGVVSLFYEHDIATPSASGSSNMHTSHSEGSSPMEDVAHALQVPALLGEAMGSNATAATAAAAAAALPVANARAMMELPLEVVSPMETSFGPDSPPLVEQSQPAGNAIRKPSLEQRKQAVMSIAEVAEPLVLTVNAATATVVESHDQPETAVGSKLPAASTTSMPGLDSISIVVTEPATSTKLRVSVSEPSGVSSPRPVYSVARHVLGFAVDPRFPELSTPGSTLSARGRRVGRSASPAVLRSLTPNCATPEQQAAQFGKLFVVPSAPIAEEAEELDDEVVDSHVLVADTVVTHAQVQLQKTPLPVGSESPQQLPVTAPRVATSNANLSMADFQVLALVGTGSFGQVSVVRHRATKEPFALKVIQKLPIVEQGQDEHVLEEQRLLLRTDTPFVVTLFATFQDRKALYFVLEYLNGGELFTYLREALRFTNTTAKFYASEVVCAIDYLHSQDIAYRDLKPENILLDSSGHIKLIDFGFARTMRATDRTWSLCGTPEYLAPEIILNKGHGREVDCWSIGVLLYEMLLGYPPFHGSNNVEMYENIITGKYSFPDCVPIYSQARLLVSQLLVSSISRRLTISEIKNHSWFEGVDWEVVKQRTRTPPFIPPVESSEDTSMFCPCDDAQEEMQWELWRRETASLGAAVEDKTETECSDLSEGSTDDCLSELIEQAASDVYDPLAQARHDHLRSLQSQASMPGLEAVTRLPDKPGFDLSLGSDTDEQMCREHATRTVQDLQQASRRQRRKERQERREQLFAQFDSVNPRFAKQLQLL